MDAEVRRQAKKILEARGPSFSQIHTGGGSPKGRRGLESRLAQSSVSSTKHHADLPDGRSLVDGRGGAVFRTGVKTRPDRRMSAGQWFRLQSLQLSCNSLFPAHRLESSQRIIRRQTCHRTLQNGVLRWCARTKVVSLKSAMSNAADVMDV